MDCKDLMVGDWVKVDQTTETVKARVLGVHKDGVINYEVDYSGVRATNQIHIDYVSPIKLTEDILVKNGYKSTQGLDFYWLDDKKHCCVKNYDGKRLFCYKQGINDVWLVVKYVHQLQHLLRLCGIEKEIEL